ncbi:MAG: hypothetical protein ACRCYY_10775 [Trueperaceae bacterium]
MPAAKKLTRRKKASKAKRPQRPRDFRKLFHDLELDGEFLASSKGTHSRLELPPDIVELLSISNRPNQDFIFYRYDGHVCLSTPQKLKRVNDVPVFKTKTGKYSTKAFCSALAITKGELDEILASPKAIYHDEPEHTLGALHEMLEMAGEAFDNQAAMTTWLNTAIWGLNWETPVTYLKRGKWSEVRSILGAIIYGGAA